MQNIIINLVARYLLITNKRFSKYHRTYETWQYRYLHTTLANIKAENLLQQQRRVI